MRHTSLSQSSTAGESGKYSLPSELELDALFQQKYGNPKDVGWSPRRRWRFGFYPPADVYEAILNRLVFHGCSWVDAGGGHTIFPENPALARTLASRCSLMVCVDPSDNIRRNDFAHRRVQSVIEEYYSDQEFDLLTLRMVVEHVSDPIKLARSVWRLLRPEGVAVVFTVNSWSPITFFSRLLPFRLHFPIKKFFWEGEEEDTFPVYYRMNTQRKLRRYFVQNGFSQAAFAHLDDLATFGRFRYLNYVELLIWKSLNVAGLRYPENCLLGIYRKVLG
jgi:SAM-dependent methyltransferase